jgi:uncharacterized protein
MTVKAFAVDDARYLYSAYTNEICAVSPALHAAFADDRPEDDRRALALKLGLEPDGGMALSVFDAPVIAGALSGLETTGPEHLVFTVTDACNFRCNYCAFSGAYQDARTHGKRRMQPEVMMKALRWYFGFDRNRYHLGFYGGEPLLQWKLIRQAVRKARDLTPPGAGLGLGMTTNGWLLGKEIDGFLARNGFDLFISIDGPQTMHDRYRKTVKGKNTFDRVLANVRRLRDAHPDYYDRHVNFSITLVPPCDPAAVSAFLAENPDIFGDKIPKVGLLNAGPSTVYDRLGVGADARKIDFSDLQNSYVDDLTTGARPPAFSRACCERPLMRIHERNMTTVPVLKTSCGQCLPGTRCHVSVDGDLFMCEHGDESFPIGDVERGLDPDRIAGLLRDYDALVRDRCEGCWAVRLCHKCIPDLSDGNRLSAARLADICRSRRSTIERELIAYCRARSRDDACFDRISAENGG